MTLDGTAYYLGTDGAAVVVHAVHGGVDYVTATVPGGGGECVANSITVSPDGQHLAWVEAGPGAVSGRLVIAAIDGSKRHAALTDTICLGPTPLAWMGSSQLLVHRVSVRKSVVDVNTAAPVEPHGDPGLETDQAWSADGAFLAAADDKGMPYVVRWNPPGAGRPYRFTPPAAEAANWDGWEARSISIDGRYVSVGWIGTDPSRRTDSWAMVDTTTSAVVSLPVSGTIANIRFDADGSVLVRQPTGRLTLLDSSLHVVDHADEPAGVRGLQLLAYVP